MQKMKGKEVKKQLAQLDGWEVAEEDGSINKAYIFDDFEGAMAFINRVADIARDMDHHPEIYNVYNEVSLSLITHDVDGLTEKDFTFAARVDADVDEDDDVEDED